MATLVKKGCERHLIEGYLRRIVSYKDVEASPLFLVGRNLYRVNRQLRDLARQIRKLAERLGKLGATRGVWDRLVHTGCHNAHDKLLRIAD
jgi:hypothetical protein